MPIPMLALAALATATSLNAQTQSTLPSGWQVRADRANAQMQNVKFVTMGDGYHVTLGPSVILYNPQQRAEGAFRARATFAQTRAPQHPEAYGLLAGGQNLDAANQDYLYFLVNGVEVAKLPRGGQLKTDGVVGLRINHNLDVHVSGFGVEPIAAGSR